MKSYFRITVFLILVFLLSLFSNAFSAIASAQSNSEFVKQILNELNSGREKSYPVDAFNIRKINSQTGEHEKIEYEKIFESDTGTGGNENKFIKIYKTDIDGDGRLEYIVCDTNDIEHDDRNFDGRLHIFNYENGNLKQIFSEQFLYHPESKIFLADFTGDSRGDMVINHYVGASAGETFNLYEFQGGKPAKICELDGETADFGSFHVDDIKCVRGTNGKNGMIEIDLRGRHFKGPNSQSYYQKHTMRYENKKFVAVKKSEKLDQIKK